MIDATLSKEVGWEKQSVNWPLSVEDVRTADDYWILKWNRFLPSPNNDNQVDIMNAIVEEMQKRRK